LNIIDLAGSERRDNHSEIEKSLDKKQLKQLEQEAVMINKSLTTLGRIFLMLADRKSQARGVLPYRDSKLTRLLN